MRTWIKSLILCLILCSPLYATTQVVRYVDTGAAGAGTGLDWTNAYTTLTACINAEVHDLQTADENYTIYCRASTSVVDATAATVTTTWNCDATRYITIEGTDFPVDGIYDATKYLRYALNANGRLYVSVNKLVLRHLQFAVAATSGTATSVRVQATPVGYADITIDSCIFRVLAGATGYSDAIYTWDSTVDLTVINSIFWGVTSTYGVLLNPVTSHSVVWYNCTAWDLKYSIRTGVAYNCISGNNTDDFYSITVYNSCSDDGDGSNPQGPLDGDWSKEMTDPNGGDFSLVAGGNCIGNGVDNPGAGLYSNDIIGTARSSTWDIGAFEYPAVPSAGGQVIMVEMQ